jgi:DNA-binding PadR family transcriptional regulator
MPLPTPLELKKFYILLALANGPLHGYALHAPALSDSRSSLYFSYTSLYRLLQDLVARGLIEGSTPANTQALKTYKLTTKGHARLRLEAESLRQATQIAAQRLARG